MPSIGRNWRITPLFGQIEHYPIECQFRRRTDNPLSAVIENVDPLLIVHRESQGVWALFREGSYR